MTGNVGISAPCGSIASLVAALCFLSAPPRAVGGDVPPAAMICPSEQDDIWAISSRQTGCGQEQRPRLSYWRFSHEAHRWTVADHETFLAAGDPSVPTCFFVHGNRISHNQAFDVGWRAYQRLRAGAPAQRRFRFVVWSWPSTQIKGQIKDVRLKAWQSEAHAYYLAWLVDQMHPQSRVSLVGYSYGARLIAGSLHILGGGRSAGRTLISRVHPDRLPLRAVLLAGALDSNALLPYGRNGLALSQVERMLVLTNPADEVLKYYRLLYGVGGRIQALGATGAAGLSSLGGSTKVAQWNVSRLVGSDHDWTRYLYSPVIVARMESYALFLE